jgi:hypothetical protein
MTYLGTYAMKTIKGSSQAPTLSDLIEIIRDPQLPSTSERPHPTEAHDSDPLITLERLVEHLEQLLDHEHKNEPTFQQQTSDLARRTDRCASELDRYVELFQKQSSVMQRIMSKLN